MVLEKTLESPLDCKEIQPVHSEGDQPWVFLGRTDAKAETSVCINFDSSVVTKAPYHCKMLMRGKAVVAGRDGDI